jgi:pimeloyl-ACP methyl ester carboxylesterase
MASEINTEKPAIVSIHGAWHGAWAFERVNPIFEEHGYHTVTPNLPIYKVETNHESHAHNVVDAIEEAGVNEVVLNAHSRGGNVVFRVPQILAERLGYVAVKKIILWGASVDEETIGRPLIEEEGKVPSKNSVLYLAGVRPSPKNKNLMLIDPDIAKQMFYHDCDPDLADWAVSQLRPQYKPQKQPKLVIPTNIPTHFNVLAFDRVITPERQIYTGLNWMGVPESRMHVFPSGHSPMLSVPDIFVAKTEGIIQTTE